MIVDSIHSMIRFIRWFDESWWLFWWKFWLDWNKTQTQHLICVFYFFIPIFPLFFLLYFFILIFPLFFLLIYIDLYKEQIERTSELVSSHSLSLERSEDANDERDKNDEVAGRVELFESESISHVPEEMTDAIDQVVSDRSSKKDFQRVESPVREGLMNEVESLFPVPSTRRKSRMNTPSIK